MLVTANGRSASFPLITSPDAAEPSIVILAPSSTSAVAPYTLAALESTRSSVIVSPASPAANVIVWDTAI